MSLSRNSLSTFDQLAGTGSNKSLLDEILDRYHPDCSASYLRSPIFAIGFGGLGVAFPVFVTAVVYIFIFRIARRAGVLKSKSITRNSKSLKTFTNSAEATSGTVVSTVVENLDQDFKKMDKEYKIASLENYSKGNKDDKERKALKTIALLLVTFTICWLPLGIVFIIRVFPKVGDSGNVARIVLGLKFAFRNIW